MDHFERWNILDKAGYWPKEDISDESYKRFDDPVGLISDLADISDNLQTLY